MEVQPQSDLLRAVLRFSLVATQASSPSDFDHDSLRIAAAGPPIDESNPRIRKLIEQILFSRRFILTYYIFIIGILLVFTLGHWGAKIAVRWRSRKGKGIPTTAKAHTRLESDDESGESSSNSTIAGTESPPRKVDGERVPLLPTEQHERDIVKGGPIARLRGWGMYQPAPMPAITTSKNVLPSNATSTLILLLLALNVFYLLYHVPFSIPMLFAFADRAGLCFVANLPILYLLSSKTQPLNVLVGSSYEGLNVFHRRLGEWMCFLALLHTVGMFGVWYTLLQPFGFSFIRFISGRIIILGLCATVAYEILYFTSVGLFRQKWYELFLGLHIVLQAAALALVFFHHHNSRPYVGVALAIFLLDRLIIRMTLATRTVPATLTVASDRSTVLLSSNIRLKKSKFPCLRTSISNGWLPSHHVFVTVPSIGREHILQAHPFTIASRAPTKGAVTASLDLIIRAQDGFSQDLLRYAQGHETTNVRFDGPYGSQTAVELLHNSEAAVILAGGSGIAVAWPLLQSLLSAPTDIEDPARKQILLLWVIRDKRHAEWIPNEQLDQLYKAGVDVKIPPPTEFGERPDVAEIVREWVAKKDVAFSGAPGHKSFGVVVSGPDGMNRAVRNACARMVTEGRQVNIEVEKFGW